MIDAMITSPATAHKVTHLQTHMLPGRAAQMGYKAKRYKMADVDETEFKILPFIIETDQDVASTKTHVSGWTQLPKMAVYTRAWGSQTITRPSPAI